MGQLILNGGKLLKLNVGRNDNNWKIIDIARYIQSEIKDCKLEFLKQKGNKTEDELIKDRKIQDGVDKRTYQVNFDRIHRKLPNYQAKWEDIQKKFKGLVKKYHPDKNRGSKKYEDILKKITLAYSQLKNTVNKAK